MDLLDWIVYAVAISAVIGLTAWSVDGVLRALGRPSRWIWLAAMTLSVGVPSVALVPGVSSVVISPAPARAPDGPLESDPSRLVAPASILLTAGALFGDAQSWLARGVVRGGDALSALPADEASIKRAWAAASLALILVLTFSFGRIWFAARGWKRATLLGREAWISRDVGPAAIGILRPRLVLPEWATQLSPGELALVLAHEEEHARARDPVLLGLGWVPLIAMPWNPFVWWQFRSLASAVEVDCDRRVLRKGVNRRSYLALLLRFAARAGGDRGPMASVVRFASPLKTRMEAMIGPKRPVRVGSAIALLAAPLLVAVACGPSVPGAIRETAAPPPDVALPADFTVPLSPIAEAMENGASAVIVLAPGPVPASARTCEYWQWSREGTGRRWATGVGQVVEARCVPPAGDSDVVFVAVPNAPTAPENSPPCVYWEPVNADSVTTRPGVIWYGRPWGPSCGPAQQPMRYDLVPSPGPP